MVDEEFQVTKTNERFEWYVSRKGLEGERKDD
jgi:hypothetical protein